MDGFQVAYPGVDNAWIHQGFYDAWTYDLKASVMSMTEQLIQKHAGKPILVTGHSLGAALAQIASIDIATYAKSVSSNTLIYLYDYGSPRWGNAVLMNYYESLIGYHFRLVNKHDIVPTIPATYLGTHSPFHHSWTEIWYTSTSPLNYTQCDGSGEDKKCDYFGDSVSDHLDYLGVQLDC